MLNLLLCLRCKTSNVACSVKLRVQKDPKQHWGPEVHNSVLIRGLINSSIIKHFQKSCFCALLNPKTRLKQLLIIFVGVII